MYKSIALLERKPELTREDFIAYYENNHVPLGAKYGCGIAQCGSCTVLLDGEPVRACVLSASAAAGQAIRTVEGLAAAEGTLAPLAGGLDPRGRGAVRLLPERTDHGRRSAARDQSCAHRRRH